MVVDSSAVVAIALNESDAGRLIEALAAAPRRLMAAPTKLEVLMVLIARTGVDAKADVSELLDALDVAIEPFGDGHAEIAAEAFIRYGRGSGHGAQLNHGDCMAYALAKATGQPLLFTGGDFSQTDVTPAL